MFGIERRKGHLGGVAPCLQFVLSTSVLLSRARQTRPARQCEILLVFFGGGGLFLFFCLFFSHPAGVALGWRATRGDCGTC